MIEQYAYRALKTGIKDNKPHIGIIALCIIQSELSNMEKILVAHACATILANKSFYDAIINETTAMLTFAIDDVAPLDYINNESAEINKVLWDKFMQDVEGMSSLEQIASLDYEIKYKVTFVLNMARFYTRERVK